MQTVMVEELDNKNCYQGFVRNYSCDEWEKKW